MRKQRDYNAEIETLSERARKSKTRKLEQLGALITATGADSLDLPTLAGALLHAVKTNDVDQREVWTEGGTAFFQQRPHAARGIARRNKSNAGKHSRSDQAS